MLQNKTQKEKDIRNNGSKNEYVGARICTVPVWVDKQVGICQQQKG